MLVDFKHQEKDENRFKDKPYGALFHEPGLGKTRIMIKILEHKFQSQEIDAAIIVTTKGLMLNWAEVELPKHSEFEYSTYVWSQDRNIKDYPYLFYFIINIDALITKAFPEVMKQFIRLYPKFAFVLDESTVAKNGKAKRTKRALQVAARAKCRFIMSGTPVVDSPMDLYSQCELLSPNLLGYKSLYAFRADYAIVKTMRFGMRSFEKIVGYRNLDKLTESLRPFASIVKKNECLDLPPRLYRTIPITFTDEQTQAYKDLKEKALAYIQNHEITAINSVSLINRLLQICSGQLKVGEGQYISINNNRLSTLKELVDEHAGKTIVWASFVNNAFDIMKLLTTDAVHLSSGMDIEHRQLIINKWKEGTAKVLVANPASAGHGITLTESHNVIYYSNYWSLEHRLQSEFRTDRIGQTESCLYTDLMTPYTVEQHVIELLTTKREMAEQIITNKLANPKEFLLELLHA